MTGAAAADGTGRDVALSLVGYYGYRNLGDDLMLAQLVARLSEHPTIGGITVCSIDHLPFPLPAKARTLLTPSPAGRVRKAWSLVRGDIVVWGGGTCLYEDGPGGIDGLRGIIRVMRLTQAFGGKYVMLGVGVGPLHTERGRILLRRIV